MGSGISGNGVRLVAAAQCGRKALYFNLQISEDRGWSTQLGSSFWKWLSVAANEYLTETLGKSLWTGSHGPSGLSRLPFSRSEWEGTAVMPEPHPTSLVIFTSIIQLFCKTTAWWMVYSSFCGVRYIFSTVALQMGKLKGPSSWISSWCLSHGRLACGQPSWESRTTTEWLLERVIPVCDHHRSRRISPLWGNVMWSTSLLIRRLSTSHSSLLLSGQVRGAKWPGIHAERRSWALGGRKGSGNSYRMSGFLLFLLVSYILCLLATVIVFRRVN